MYNSFSASGWGVCHSLSLLCHVVYLLRAPTLRDILETLQRFSEHTFIIYLWSRSGETTVDEWWHELTLRSQAARASVLFLLSSERFVMMAPDAELNSESRMRCVCNRISNSTCFRLKKNISVQQKNGIQFYFLVRFWSNPCWINRQWRPVIMTNWGEGRKICHLVSLVTVNVSGPSRRLADAEQHTTIYVEKVATAKCAPISIYTVNDVYHAAITVEKTVRVCRMCNQNCYELAGVYEVFSLKFFLRVTETWPFFLVVTNLPS